MDPKSAEIKFNLKSIYFKGQNKMPVHWTVSNESSNV